MSERDLQHHADFLARGEGSIHMMGVGGVGMAGLAYHLVRSGFQVTGCDRSPNHLTAWIANHGVRVVAGHDAGHIDVGTDCLIRSAAVPLHHPEVERAQTGGCRVLKRGDALAAFLLGKPTVAVSGTHGKTTTSALITHLLRTGGTPPSFCIGGEVESLGGVAGEGEGAWYVVEADESDGTVARYEPDIGVITNIEYDHMEHFAGTEAVEACFKEFAGKVRRRLFYCEDDPVASALLQDRAGVRSYGLNSNSQVRAAEMEMDGYQSRWALWVDGRCLGRVTSSLTGLHNVQNALGACAVALELDVGFAAIEAGLRSFTPPKRRFEIVTEQSGVIVISDYAHHPTEIRVLVESARRLGGSRVLAVFQPHRYSRTLALGPAFPPAFEGVDKVVLTPVYAASETPLKGGTTRDLVSLFEEQRRMPVEYADSLSAAWDGLRKELKAGDVLLVVGAGDVEQIAAWAKASFEETVSDKDAITCR